MATYSKAHPDVNTRLGSTPWGNVTAFRYTMATDSSGKLVGYDSGGALAALAPADVVRLGTLPAGFRYINAVVNVTTALKTDTTATVGFAYKDGVDDNDAPQGAAKIIGALAATAGKTEQSTPSFLLQKDAWLTLTPAEETQDGVSALEIIVYAIAEGVK